MDFDYFFKRTYKDKIDDSIYHLINREDFETSISKVYVENEEQMTMTVYSTVYVDYYSYQDNEDRKCLTVKSFVDLEKPERFKILEIVEYEKHIMNNCGLDSKSLLPINPNYEKISSEILEKYYTKSELSNYIDSRELAKRMGLEVEYHKLSNDDSVFGLSCFKDCTIKVYDDDSESDISIKQGTIVVDRETLSDYGGFNSENFTIAHECVHWYLHKKFVFLEQNCLQYVSCSDDGIVSSIKSFEEAFKIMEYQANGIAARLLLPTRKIKSDFEQLYDFLILKNNKIKTIESCIDAISSHSRVSREAVKIRLEELGYKVGGINEYVDGKYVLSYLYDSEIDSNDSYSISEFNLLMLIMKNPNFERFIRDKNYIFVNNHLCLNLPKYVASDNCLTNYALEHIDECCILFKYKSINRKRDIVARKSVLFRSNSKGRDFYVEAFVSPIELVKNKNISFHDEFKKNQDLLEKIHNMDIHDAIRECRDSRSISREDTATMSGYSDQNIKEIENNKKRGVSLENILRISFALALSKDIIYKLLEIGNISLDNEVSEKNFIYKTIINVMPQVTSEEINDFLIRNGQKPLFP